MQSVNGILVKNLKKKFAVLEKTEPRKDPPNLTPPPEYLVPLTKSKPGFQIRKNEVVPY